jgi:dihydroxyacid dehydratase/phosphogluconate dehydratase
LRSDAWLGGDDEVALNHRAALRAAGLRRPGRRPLIGIACTASDLNRCDRGLTTLAAAVKRGVQAAGGLPLEFGVMSLSEDLMKPTAMLYRNLLAIEVEETIRSQPLDGIVALGNCDKTVPAYLMALASADIPGLVVTGGRLVPLCCGIAGRRWYSTRMRRCAAGSTILRWTSLLHPCSCWRAAGPPGWPCRSGATSRFLPSC